MEYIWIVLLAIVYVVIWNNTMHEDRWRGVYWTPFEVEKWKKVGFYEIWVWLHEIALIVLFIFSVIKFIQKWR